MKITILPTLLIAGTLVMFSCKPTIEEFTPSKGDADFTTFLALGDSWAAGFADGALYKSGQEMSFPAILAIQMGKAGGGGFRQPLMLDDIGIGLGLGTPKPKLELAFRQDCLGNTILAPGYVNEPINPANLQPLGDPNPFNNISVPAMQSIHLGIEGYGGLNPYYGRFAMSAQSKVLDEIPRVNPSFFVLAIGAYDVLMYALIGGEGGPPTDPLYLAGSVDAALQTLTANGAKGVIANVPDILAMPFFKTIPFNVLALTEQAQADALNAAYAPLNQMILGSGSTDTIHFQIGYNPVVIKDASLPWGMRQIHDDELLLMSVPQDSLKCAGWGSQKAIAENYVLDATEISVIETAIGAYNTSMQQLASAYALALVDFHKITIDLAYLYPGMVVDGVTITSSLVTGNFYSLDGLTPTPLGNAVLANYFIKAINQHYNASLPEVVVTDYPAVILP